MYEKTQERLFDIFVIIMYTTYILLLFVIILVDSKIIIVELLCKYSVFIILFYSIIKIIHVIRKTECS